ncbi:hypothetical protein [Rubneribacter sp.]
MDKTSTCMPHMPKPLLSSCPHTSSDQTLRWYVAYAGEGREDALATKLASALSPAVLTEAFCPKWEMLMKRRGVWLKAERVMFTGYVVLASAHPRALMQELSHLSFPVVLAGKRGRTLLPIEAEVQRWLERSLDGSHVLRASEGVIHAGKLTVEHGPLQGSEARVKKVDRHKSMAWVGLGNTDSQFLLRVALAVPKKD